MPKIIRLKRPKPRVLYHGPTATLQAALMLGSLWDLQRDTGIPARRLVAFGNGSAVPTVGQVRRICSVLSIPMIMMKLSPKDFEQVYLGRQQVLAYRSRRPKDLCRQEWASIDPVVSPIEPEIKMPPR